MLNLGPPNTRSFCSGREEDSNSGPPDHKPSALTTATFYLTGNSCSTTWLNPNTSLFILSRIPAKVEKNDLNGLPVVTSQVYVVRLETVNWLEFDCLCCLYARYQYDPNTKIQQAMTSIWAALVPETKKTVSIHLIQNYLCTIRGKTKSRSGHATSEERDPLSWLCVTERWPELD